MSSPNNSAAGSAAPTLDEDRYRADWQKATQLERPFYLDRPPMFSSAAAAQDSANRSRMLWSWAPIWIPWEYTHWLDEGRSFHDTAYIGDWSGLVKVRFKGPQALDFLSFIGTNDLSKFQVGQAKHHVQVTEAGKIAAQGLLYRTGNDEFIYTGGSTYWALYRLKQGKWDAQAETQTSDYFLFSVQGPNSRKALEAASGADLGGVRFNHSVVCKIAGADVRLIRTGITGELGYELHGSSRFGNSVWATIVEAGGPFGLKQLGVRAQIISHVEAGIATNDRDFVSAAIATPGAPQIPPTARSKPIGSFPLGADMSQMFRSPTELGWRQQVSLETHDFLGRDALKAEARAGGPPHRLCGLVWNSKDVVDVYATLFGDEPIVSPMEMPRYLGLAVDKVLDKGKGIGTSTSRVYSPYLRQMISLGHVPAASCKAGTALSVVWGDADGPQKEVRATVVDLPFKQDVRRA